MKRSRTDDPTSQNAHATAITAARAEGEAAGEKTGAAAAYARLSAILADARIKGRERAAVSLACKSPDMSIEAILFVVSQLGAPQRSIPSLSQRMANCDDGEPMLCINEGPAAEPSFVARMRARHSVQPAEPK